jgi:hypothetical protein
MCHFCIISPYIFTFINVGTFHSVAPSNSSNLHEYEMMSAQFSVIRTELVLCIFGNSRGSCTVLVTLKHLQLAF